MCLRAEVPNVYVELFMLIITAESFLVFARCCSDAIVLRRTYLVIILLIPSETSKTLLHTLVILTMTWPTFLGLVFVFAALVSAFDNLSNLTIGRQSLAAFECKWKS